MARALKIVIYLLVFLLLFLTFMPLVSWWAGLVALGLAALLYYVLFYQQHWAERFESINFWYIFRLSLYGVFFGVVVNLGCSVYSNIRVGQLYDECQQQKAIAFENLNKNQINRNTSDNKD